MNFRHRYTELDYYLELLTRLSLSAWPIFNIIASTVPDYEDDRKSAPLIMLGFLMTFMIFVLENDLNYKIICFLLWLIGVANVWVNNPKWFLVFYLIPFILQLIRLSRGAYNEN